MNLYAYAGNNPIAFTDPFGLRSEECCVEALASAAATAAVDPEPVTKVGATVVTAVIGAVVLGKLASDKLDEYKSVTYTRTNAAGQVYSGRTSGFGTPGALVAKREASHPERLAGFGPAVVDKVGYGVKGAIAIRGREQQLIDAHGGAQSEGGASANLIRGVSRANPLAPVYDATSTAMFGPVVP